MADQGYSVVGDACVRKFKGPAEQFVDPVFQIVSQRDPLSDGRRGIFATAGNTKVFAFGHEVQNVVAVKVETDYGGVDSVPKTTITLTVYGSQVRTVFADEIEAAAASPSEATL